MFGTTRHRTHPALRKATATPQRRLGFLTLGLHGFLALGVVFLVTGNLNEVPAWAGWALAAIPIVVAIGSQVALALYLEEKGHSW